MLDDAAITVQRLSKRYRLGDAVRYPTLRDAVSRLARRRRDVSTQGEVWALRDVSFELPKGTVLGLIGANGAGKSTLLKILSRVTLPTEGRAVLRGRVGSLLEVGTGFHPELTGRENIFMNGALLGMRRHEIRSRLDQIVAFAGVETHLDTPVKRYSSGMHVRLGFAVAAHLQPEVLLVDEVLSVGDAAFQRKCLGKVEEVARSGRTVILVSHNMASVQGLSQRCIWLDRGRVVVDGETADVVARYLESVSATGDPGSDGELTDRTNAYTPGHIFLRRVEVRDQAGRPAREIGMGETIVVDVEVDGLESLSGCDLGAIIRTPTNAWVGAANGSMLGFDFGSAAGPPFQLRLTLVEPRLNTGRFLIDLSLTRAGARIDFAEGAAQLFVRERDVFGTGFAARSRLGVVYFCGRWEDLAESARKTAR